MSTASTIGQPVAVLEGRDRPALTAWLLLGPCVLYLLAFSIYPLIYSLRLSFTDLTAATGTGSFGRACTTTAHCWSTRCSGTPP